jgi:hypothetical protein
VPFVYQSGETIMHGDRVLYGGNPGEVEFVIDPRGSAEDRRAEQYDWFMEEYGGGVMIREPKVFGRMFVSDPETDEDLVFVSRQGGNN